MFFFNFLLNDLIVSDFGKFILIFRLFFLAFGDQCVILIGKSEVSFLLKFFFVCNYFNFCSVLKDFDIVFALLIIASGFVSFLFLFDRIDFVLKVFVLLEDGILEIGKFDIVDSEILLLRVHVTFHMLVLFRRLDDIFDEWFFGAVDDSPECVVLGLGLFFFE